MEEENEWESIRGSIRYDKGGNRMKHIGNDSGAYIDISKGQPIGKCPKDFSHSKAEELLKEAIPEFFIRSQDRPKTLWNSYDGVVYCAKRSDGNGESWHAYPVKQDIPPKILRKLLDKVDIDEQNALKKWIKS